MKQFKVQVRYMANGNTQYVVMKRLYLFFWEDVHTVSDEASARKYIEAFTVLKTKDLG